MNAEQITTRYTELLARKDRLNAELKDVEEELRELQTAFLHWAEEQGVDQVKGDGITLSIRKQPTAQITDWAAACRWAVETGNEHIIQRRLKAGELQELAINDTPIPDCILLGEVERVAHRRS